MAESQGHLIPHLSLCFLHQKSYRTEEEEGNSKGEGKEEEELGEGENEKEGPGKEKGVRQ